MKAFKTALIIAGLGAIATTAVAQTTPSHGPDTGYHPDRDPKATGPGTGYHPGVARTDDPGYGPGTGYHANRDPNARGPGTGYHPDAAPAASNASAPHKK